MSARDEAAETYAKSAERFQDIAAPIRNAYREGWDAGREELQRSLDAGLAELDSIEESEKP